MLQNAIRKKFGDDHIADAHTFIIGIDRRFTAHFAERFKGCHVLENCTGGGFTTVPLARTAAHVVTVEIDSSIQHQAVLNVEKAWLSSRVSFIQGSILDRAVLDHLPNVDAAFIDPDWAVTGPDHVYRFVDSNTQPPADIVFETIRGITDNVALVLPPLTAVGEFDNLPQHERQRLYLGCSHELYCLYFGMLMSSVGDTNFIATD